MPLNLLLDSNPAKWYNQGSFDFTFHFEHPHLFRSPKFTKQR